MRNRVLDAVLISVLYLVLRIGIPAVKLGHMHPAGKVAVVVLSVFLLMLAQLAVIVAIARTRPRVGQAAILTVVGFAVFVGLLMFTRDPGHASWASRLGGVRDLSLLAACSFLGILVSFIIRDPKLLLPVLIAAAAVDFWNIFIGPLGELVEKSPQVVAKASVSLPTPVPAITVTMGGGDAVFLALFFAVLFRFSLNARGTFWLGYALLVVSMMLVLFGIGALPALVPMGIAVLLANYRYMNLSREEWMATLYVLALVVILLVISGVWMSRQRAAKKPVRTGMLPVRSIISLGCGYGRQV